MRLTALVTLLVVLVATAFGAVHGHGVRDGDDGRTCSACQLRSNPAELTEVCLTPLPVTAVPIALAPVSQRMVEAPARWRTAPEQGPPARA